MENREAMPQCPVCQNHETTKVQNWPSGPFEHRLYRCAWCWYYWQLTIEVSSEGCYTPKNPWMN
jgi:hypothetical protein